MASEIRVDKINSLSGVGTVTLSPTGVDIAGITTAATLRATTGIVTSLTAGSLTSLGAVSGTTGTFTGDLTIPDKIVHTGDTNTTIRFPAADTVTVETAGSERVRIDSDGKIGIGTASPATDVHTLSSSDHVITHQSGTSGADVRMNFRDNGSVDQGGIHYAFNGNSMRFRTAQGERLRITSAGRLGLNTDSPDTTFTIKSGGDAQMSLKNSSGTTKAYLGTDGAFGSASTDDLRIRSDSSNIIFGFSGTERIRMLSGGGITFNGDTAAANALDDYEEGTWSPTYKVGSGSSYTMSAATYTSSNTGGTYQKIGRLVTFALRIQCSSFTINNGAQVTIIGLPFTSTTNSDIGTQHGATFSYAQAICASNNGYIPQLHVPDNSQEIDFYTCNGNTYQTGDGNNNFGNTLHIHGQYITNS